MNKGCIFWLHKKNPEAFYPAPSFAVRTCASTHGYLGKGTPNGTILPGRCFLLSMQHNITSRVLVCSSTYDPYAWFPRIHRFYITERVFGHTPDFRIRGLKRKGLPRQTIFNTARGYLCPSNYTVIWTDYIDPLYHLTGYLAYNPVENT